MRDLKFRAWHRHPIEHWVMSEVVNIEFSSKSVNTIRGSFPHSMEDEKLIILMQYTGFKLNEDEIYEADIIREEDDGEVRHVVVTWIKEWCMFACLIVCEEMNEYETYLKEGAEGLDESMFWTFPIRREKYGAQTLVGNIYQNPELIKL